MQLVVHADTQQKQAFLAKGLPDGISIIWLEQAAAPPAADAFFDLRFEETGTSVFEAITDKPVFVNAVITERSRLADNMIRINAWNGFLERPEIEISALPAMREKAAVVMEALTWRYQLVADTPGLIAARILAMIINEAYFGLGDGISTRTEIDTAMRLGTNYPYGPFEWSEKIGLHKIHDLLTALSRQDARYSVAPALQEACVSNTSN
jgi:3-hydroxybutyryl-CoA dehydrogenase